MGLFGKKKNKNPRATGEKITKLREHVATLEKKQQFLEKKIEVEQTEIRKYLAQKNRRRAMLCLKRKKTYEGQVSKLNQAMMTLEQQVIALEGAQTNKDILDTMVEGNTAMKEIHGDLSAEKVDDVMDDIRDQMDVANEIGEAITMGLGQDEAEGDLMDELDALDTQMMEEDLLKSPAVPDNPVSSQPAPAVQEAPEEASAEEEDELKKLQMEMGMLD